MLFFLIVRKILLYKNYQFKKIFLFTIHFMYSRVVYWVFYISIARKKRNIYRILFVSYAIYTAQLEAKPE